MRAGIYTRVSTTDQHPEMQEEELVRYVKNRGWTVYNIYEDRGVCGATDKRPGLDSLLRDCHRRKVDVVVVWKFDRFGRSLRQLVNALELFRKLGIGFVSCTEAIDTSLPYGETLFQLIGIFAELEHRLIVERVRAGLEHARAQGKRLGRPVLRQLSPREIRQLRSERVTRRTPFRVLAKKYGISVWTAHSLCTSKSKTCAD